jgi:transcriptional antiterminator Rof (Rho-off)
MDYRPIACDFHDDLEAYAVTRRRVRILHAPADAPEPVNGAAEPLLRSEGRIRDIVTNAQKEEFLSLDDGASIRLDRIRSVEALADLE